MGDDPAETSPLQAAVEGLRRGLNARASGLWRRSGDQLLQAVFVAAEDMPEVVARGFALATQSVPIDRTDLGIVRAVVDGEPVVSVAETLPPGTGSGLWLRAFGAARSVAVPLRNESGEITAVLSVAVPATCRLDATAIAERVLTSGRAMLSS